MKVLGIDLSLTSPAVCYFEGEEFNFNGCKFYYLTKQKKLQGIFGQLEGTMIDDYESNDMMRYHFISTWILNILYEHSPEHIFIEDYSFASTGRVFNIAENCGILKYNLWKSNVTYTTIPPTVVKKAATGKGNSKKEVMEEMFIQETGFNIRDRLQLSRSVSNPVSDVIDSYFVIKAGLTYSK